MVNDSFHGNGFCFIRTRIFMFSEFYSFCFFLFYMHDKSYSSGLFLCIPIRERELSVTVELSMPEVQTDHSETAELSKPQLRMVDLNLLTVFDAVMQEQNITRAAHVLGMSQPAVSNAVARLKVMFNDELLFVMAVVFNRLLAHFNFLAQFVRHCN